MKVTLINASPKKRGSVSGYLLRTFTALLKPEAVVEPLAMSLWDSDFFEDICESDTLVFIFPLYCDALPSSFLRLLMAFEERLKENPTSLRVYGMVNAGFLEGTQNRYALEVLAHFCKRSGLKWCGGIGIGGGPMIQALETTPWKSKPKRAVYKGMFILATAIKKKKSLSKDLLITPKIPRFIYIHMANWQWITSAKKRGLSKKDLYRQP